MKPDIKVGHRVGVLIDEIETRGEVLEVEDYMGLPVVKLRVTFITLVPIEKIDWNEVDGFTWTG